MTNVVFKSTSTLMNKITKVTRRNLENLGQTKFAFNAYPDRGFIHIFTSVSFIHIFHTYIYVSTVDRWGK